MLEVTDDLLEAVEVSMREIPRIKGTGVSRPLLLDWTARFNLNINIILISTSCRQVMLNRQRTKQFAEVVKMLVKKEQLKIFLPVLLAVLALAVLAGCSSAGGNANKSASVPEGWPEVLHYGVVPGESQETIARTYKPVVDALSEYLGIKVEMYMGTDYTSMIEAMRTKKLDVAEFGPFSYVIAHERSGAEAFATPAKSPEEAFYYSLIIVPAKSNINTLDDLKGKKFLFVDPVSTSGNLIPHAMLAKHFGVLSAAEVDALFSSVSFSGGHDASILAVARGDADGAGISSSTLEKMIKSGALEESDIRVIKKSDPIPKDPVAYRSDLPQDLKDKIREFFLNFKNEEFFKEMGINGYYPTDDSKFDVIRKVVKALNLTPEELLKK